AQADVVVEHLAQRDVERADAAADGRGERAFDADEIFLERLDGVVGQPVVEFFERLFAGENLEPGNLSLAAVGFGHRRVEHAHAAGPDVRAGAVAADEGEDGIFGNGEFAVRDGDFSARGRGNVFIGHNID